MLIISVFSINSLINEIKLFKDRWYKNYKIQCIKLKNEKQKFIHIFIDHFVKNYSNIFW